MIQAIIEHPSSYGFGDPSECYKLPLWASASVRLNPYHICLNYEDNIRGFDRVEHAPYGDHLAYIALKLEVEDWLKDMGIRYQVFCYIVHPAMLDSDFNLFTNYTENFMMLQFDNAQDLMLFKMAWS